MVYTITIDSVAGKPNNRSEEVMAKQKTKKMKHDDELEDKKLIKKMVKSECQKDEKPAKKGKRK